MPQIAGLISGSEPRGHCAYFFSTSRFSQIFLALPLHGQRVRNILGRGREWWSDEPEKDDKDRELGRHCFPSLPKCREMKAYHAPIPAAGQGPYAGAADFPISRGLGGVPGRQPVPECRGSRVEIGGGP